MVHVKEHYECVKAEHEILHAENWRQKDFLEVIGGFGGFRQDDSVHLGEEFESCDECRN